MKNAIRPAFERFDHLVFSALPLKYTFSWLNLVRGQYPAENAEMYSRAFHWLRLNQVEGDVLEFGTGSGGTFCLMANYAKRIDPSRRRRFFLFDSFQGLPECNGDDAHPQWQKGAWAFSADFVRKRGRRYGVAPEDTILIPGFYEESLRPELRSELGIGKAALIHIDCDLKTSTEAALEWAVPFVQTGTVVLMDDYFCYSGDVTKGEAGAFHEWVQKHGLTANPWKPYAFHGNSFILSR
jgi:hypothetical protein